MLRFFKTTLVTNLLQLPLFEAVLAMAHRLPLSPAMQGTCTGLLFATVRALQCLYAYIIYIQYAVH